jgi:hypothetical protein
MACFPSPASITSCPAASRDLMIGIQRVAWPSPQSRGATNIFIFCLTLFKCLKSFIYSDYTKLAELYEDPNQPIYRFFVTCIGSGRVLQYAKKEPWCQILWLSECKMS